MEYTFSTLLASFLVIPILYVLRLGLSAIGIVIVAFLSFLFVELLLLSQAVFPLWQGALIMLLFALCVSYLLQKRMSHFLFTETQGEDMILELSAEAVKQTGQEGAEL
ncbi:MAG: hypothetical protein ACE3JP_03065 [Ectobacillus sp.]